MCRVVETLKDYAIKALINTVDHLGSVAFKVNNLLDEKIGEVSETELQFTCLEQVWGTPTFSFAAYCKGAFSSQKRNTKTKKLVAYNVGNNFLFLHGNLESKIISGLHQPSGPLSTIINNINSQAP